MLRLRRALRVVGQGPSLNACLPDRAGLTPDLVVVDAASLEAGGLEGTVATLAEWPAVRVVVILGAGERASACSLPTVLRHAILTRDDSFEVLLRRLEDVCGNESATAGQDEGAPRHKPLTDREAEVLALMGEGLTTREIAEVLGRSLHTIQTHRKRISEKLGRLGCSLTQRVIGHRSTYFGTDGISGPARPD